MPRRTLPTRVAADSFAKTLQGLAQRLDGERSELVRERDALRESLARKDRKLEQLHEERQELRSSHDTEVKQLQQEIMELRSMQDAGLKTAEEEWAQRLAM